jgi:hypothetical protein
MNYVSEKFYNIGPKANKLVRFCLGYNNFEQGQEPTWVGSGLICKYYTYLGRTL